MAGEATDDELLLTEELPETDDEQRGEEDEQSPEVNDEGNEEEVLSFGDEPAAPGGETNLVKHLRDEIKRRNDELAELRRVAPQRQPIEVGEKPTLAGCDYDEDAFTEQFEAWQNRKRAADNQKNETQQTEEQERKAWETELQRVDREKRELNAPDADEAFDTVRGTLSAVQQAALVKSTDNTARIILALAKNPDRLAELAAIQDPLKFAAKAAKLEATLKVVKRRAVAAPEKIERGSGSASHSAVDRKLEKLEKQAAATGDRTELVRYKRERARGGK